MAIIFAIQGLTQTTVTIGSGTSTTSSGAIPGYYGFHNSALLFTANEMTQSGTIQSFGLEISTSSLTSNRSMKIYLKEVSDATLASSQIMNNLLDGATLVYDSTNVNCSSTGWRDFVFGTPFNYSGINNLLVIVTGSGCSASGGCSVTIKYSSTPSGMAWNKLKDNSNIDFSISNSSTNSYRFNSRFNMTALPSDYCYPPSNFSLSSLNSTTANFNWTSNTTPTNYTFEYKSADSETWITSNTTSTNYSLTGLTPSTNYNVRVKSNCNSSGSIWINYSFKTECEPISLLPYSESFDTYGTGTAATSYPSCWTRNVSISANTPYISSTAISSPGAMYFYGYNVDREVAVCHPIDATIPINTLTVYFKMRYSTLDNNGIQVGVMSDPNDFSTFVPIGNRQTLSAVDTWEEKAVDLIDYSGNGKYIALAAIAPASEYARAYVDDFIINYTPNCPNVYGLNLEAASTTSVKVTWDNSTDMGDGFNIAYSSNLNSPFNPANATIIPLTTGTHLPYIISGFNAGDSVWVAVQRNCGGNWSNAVKVNLPNFANSIPFVANFEDPSLDNIWTITNGTQTNKWFIGTPGANESNPTDEIDERGLFISNDNGVSATYTTSLTYPASASSVVFASTLVAFDNSPSFELSFDWSNYGESGWDGINVYLLPLGETLTPGTLPNAQYKLNPEYLTLQSNFQTYTQAYGAEYSNSIKQLVFCWRNDGSGGSNPPAKIDNISLISYSCAIPSGLTSLSSTNNSLTLDWDATDDANVNSWIVEYKPIDDTEWLSQNVTSHPYELTGLQSSTVYQVRITSICSLGDTNNPSEIENFGMPCETISNFPWNEGFEKVWFVAAGLNTATHPWCWTNFDGGASTSYYWRKTTLSSYIHSGSGALQMYAGNATGQLGDWIITPTITLTGNQILGFWAKGYSTSIDDLSVKIFDVTANGIVDTVADTSLFIDIMPNKIISASDWIEYEVNLDQYTGDYQIAFVRNTTGGYYLNIDDISIKNLPACARPINIEINSIASNQAEIEWTPGHTGDASWYLYYKNSFDPNYDSILISSNPYTLQNLLPQANYTFYLKTNCGTELSEPTNIFNINTPQTPPTSL